MKRLLGILILVFVMSSTVFSGVMDGPGAPALKKGDVIVGGKLALGAVYGASVGYVVSGEYGFKDGFLSLPNFPASLGLGVSLGYSSYSDDYYWGTWTYRNILILGSGYWHVDLFKKEQFDTYAVVNVGFNVATSSWDSKYSDYKPSSSSNGGLVFGTGVGMRYYFTPQLSAVGEVGFGMGILRLGLDFKV